MKYLDEFQDPELAKRLLDDIHATAKNPWAMMEVCGGQTHTIIRHGLDQLLPDGIELIHGPGCPVCVTPLEVIDKALEIAVAARRHLLLVRRHAARAGQRQGPVPGQERRRRRPRRVLPARRAEHRPAEPGQAGRLLRDRLRDHGAAQRDDGLPGQEARHRELQPARQPRPRATGDRGDHDLAGVPGAGVPRGRARVHGDGDGRVPRAGRALRRADRGHRLRAARHPRGHPPHGAPARGGPGRGRERLPARGRRGGQPGRGRGCSRTSSRSSTGPGAASA